jgi:hypothetical protein
MAAWPVPRTVLKIRQHLGLKSSRIAGTQTWFHTVSGSRQIFARHGAASEYDQPRHAVLIANNRFPIDHAGSAAQKRFL